MAGVSALIGVAAAVALMARAGRFRPADPLTGAVRTVVHRADLGSTLTTSGLTESGSNTIISCQLERLDFRSTGGTEMSTGGASMIIDLLPEGTMVKQGDVLCRLNSTDYEELVRQQQIKVDQARTAVLQARLDLDVAELAVREHEEGLHKQSVEELEGEIVFGESNLERSIDRMNWTSRMLEKGYASLSQRATAERAVTTAKLSLLAAKWELENYAKFGHPKSQKVLAATVEKCRYNKISNERRLTRMEERLAHYKQMVEFCTIKAPHDGFLVYATDPNKPWIPRIDVGTTVRQSQKLFFLPDLKDMTVLTYLHESVAHRVRVGMAARTTIDGLGGATLPGRVESIAPLPVAPGGWLSSGEVKYFIAVVRLDKVPDGMRPGLTSHVEIDVDRREDVLAIPSQALAVRDGQDFCYVAGEDGVERRAVKIGRSTRDLLEVTSGLAEGEEVLVQPDRVDSLDRLVVASEPAAEPGPADAAGSSGSDSMPAVGPATVD